MSMKETDNTNTTKENTTSDSVYTIHLNKYIEYISNKSTTDKYENAHIQAVAIEFSRRRNFYFENVLQTEGVCI